MEFGIVLAVDVGADVNVDVVVDVGSTLSYHDGDSMEDDDDSSMRRRFFFFAVRLSWPESVFESSLSDSLDDDELDDDDDELELLELSDA